MAGTKDAGDHVVYRTDRSQHADAHRHEVCLPGSRGAILNARQDIGYPPSY